MNENYIKAKRRSMMSRFRVRWLRWWNRGTKKAYQNLAKAIQADPSYADVWRCHLAMPIWEGANGKLSLDEANQIADDLMKHLFDGPNGLSL